MKIPVKNDYDTHSCIVIGCKEGNRGIPAFGLRIRLRTDAVHLADNNRTSGQMQGYADGGVGERGPPNFSNLQESLSKKLARQPEGWPQYFQ